MENEAVLRPGPLNNYPFRAVATDKKKGSPCGLPKEAKGFRALSR